MKRLHINLHNTTVNNLDDIDSDTLMDSLPLKSEHLEAKRLRRFRQQLA